jgi:hypothetical protein
MRLAKGGEQDLEPDPRPNRVLRITFYRPKRADDRQNHSYSSAVHTFTIMYTYYAKMHILTESDDKRMRSFTCQFAMEPCCTKIATLCSWQDEQCALTHYYRHRHPKSSALHHHIIHCVRLWRFQCGNASHHCNGSPSNLGCSPSDSLAPRLTHCSGAVSFGIAIDTPCCSQAG